VTKAKRKKSWVYGHSLGIVSVLLLLAWTIGYSCSSPETRLGERGSKGSQ